jgi:DNA-binding response OmpR family regulator
MANDLVLQSVEKTDEKLAMSAALLMQARGRGPVELKALVTSAMIVLSDVAEQFEEGEEPAPAANGKARRAPRKPAAVDVEHSVRQLKGVDVDLTGDNESITYRGKTMELSAKQARLLEPLVQAEGRFVDRDRLITAVWGRSAPATAESGITQLCDKLAEPLAAVGLQLVRKRKVGVALQAKG